jgi:hypothetical protein
MYVLCISGDNVLRFELEDKKWRKYELTHMKNESGKRKFGLKKCTPEEAHGDADFFDILTVYHGLKSVIGTYSQKYSF